MTFPKPQANIAPNTPAYETTAVINPNGFREYDARWQVFGEINLNGFFYLGLGLGTQLKRHHKMPSPKIVVGHDYRSYSLSIKQALMNGLMASGCTVMDIGLCLSPTVYFAQTYLGAQGLAMVTASHNDNGWSGVKMGLEPRLTHGPVQMAELRDIVLNAAFTPAETGKGGTYQQHFEVRQAYVNHLTAGLKLSRPLKVVLATGNGTAGLFAEEVFSAVGCDVLPLHTTLDYTYPHFNPNPENNAFMEALAAEVRTKKADLGLAFDGDGDRVGVADHTGTFLYNDKLALILARFLAKQHQNATFVVDVKSTGLFMVDEVLKQTGANVIYWKTGHSHIKRKVAEENALAGFEKSGHFFFNQPATEKTPLGDLYDDGLAGGLMLLRAMDSAKKSVQALMAELPETYQAPTYHPPCADEKKYQVVDHMVSVYEKAFKEKATIGGQSIKDLITVNGVRLVLADGTWGLVRASSNVPSLVVTGESPESAESLSAIMADIQARLGTEANIQRFLK